MKRKCIAHMIIMVLVFVIGGCKKEVDPTDIIGGELFYSSIYYQENQKAYLPILSVNPIEDVDIVRVVIKENYSQDEYHVEITEVVSEGEVNKYNLYYIFLNITLSESVSEINIIKIDFNINDQIFSYKPQKMTFFNNKENNLKDFVILDMPVQTPQQQEMQIIITVNTPEIKYVKIETTSPDIEIVSINDMTPQDFYKHTYSGYQVISLEVKLTDSIATNLNFSYNIIFNMTYLNQDYQIVSPTFHLDRYIGWLREEYK